jgi:hypothetical protein
LLYTQAERSVEESCALESDGMEEHYVKYLCQPGNVSALSRLLGRSVACFSRCRIGNR